MGSWRISWNCDTEMMLQRKSFTIPGQGEARSEAPRELNVFCFSVLLKDTSARQMLELLVYTLVISTHSCCPFWFCMTSFFCHLDSISKPHPTLWKAQLLIKHGLCCSVSSGALEHLCANEQKTLARSATSSQALPSVQCAGGDLPNVIQQWWNVFKWIQLAGSCMTL